MKHASRQALEADRVSDRKVADDENDRSQHRYGIHLSYTENIGRRHRQDSGAAMAASYVVDTVRNVTKRPRPSFCWASLPRGTIPIAKGIRGGHGSRNTWEQTGHGFPACLVLDLGSASCELVA